MAFFRCKSHGEIQLNRTVVIAEPSALEIGHGRKVLRLTHKPMTRESFERCIGLHWLALSLIQDKVTDLFRALVIVHY